MRPYTPRGKDTALEFAAYGNGRAFFALTPSPSPTLWEKGVGHTAARSPSPASRERGTQGVRAKRRACLFTPTRGKSPLPQRFCAESMYPSQLTPSPSPTAWERGVGAHGGAPCVSPSPASRERGTKGVRAKDRAWLRAYAGKNCPCLRDSVLNRCTLISSLRFPLLAGGTIPSAPLAERDTTNR